MDTRRVEWRGGGERWRREGGEGQKRERGGMEERGRGGTEKRTEEKRGRGGWKREREGRTEEREGGEGRRRERGGRRRERREEQMRVTTFARSNSQLKVDILSMESGYLVVCVCVLCEGAVHTLLQALIAFHDFLSIPNPILFLPAFQTPTVACGTNTQRTCSHCEVHTQHTDYKLTVTCV